VRSALTRAEHTSVVHNDLGGGVPPKRPFVQGASLAARLVSPPDWLGGRRRACQAGYVSRQASD
jgi:hypothetical protein